MHEYLSVLFAVHISSILILEGITRFRSFEEKSRKIQRSTSFTYVSPAETEKDLVPKDVLANRVHDRAWVDVI